MVQTYTAPVRVFKYPFELVMAAYERRFPTCHLIPVFVGSDKINEDISEDGSIHVIERRCKIAIDAPYLLRKITGVDQVLFLQKNTLNKRKRVLKIEAQNESFSNHININELCHYRVSPENEDWTIFEQQASLEIKSFWGFEHVVEKLAVKHYSQNIKKGEEIINYHINELAQEGITYIPRFIAANDNNSDNEGDDNPEGIKNQSKEQSNLQNKNQNGLISKFDSINISNSASNSSKKMIDFRSNSVEEKLQQTKQKFLQKCDNLKKKTNSFENSNGLKSPTNQINETNSKNSNLLTNSLSLS